MAAADTFGPTGSKSVATCLDLLVGFPDYRPQVGKAKQIRTDGVSKCEVTHSSLNTRASGTWVSFKARIEVNAVSF